VVPDLEVIAREYLRALEDVTSGRTSRSADYHWMKLELIDQLSREESGGEMARFLTKEEVSNIDFVRSRIGTELDELLAERKNPRSSTRRLAGKSIGQILEFIRNKGVEVAAGVIGGARARKSVRVGRFRDSGEVHRWMYDRYSLPKLLKDVGYSDPRVCAATESRIDGFGRYQLDVVNGRVRKPDSLFVEAVKP